MSDLIRARLVEARSIAHVTWAAALFLTLVVVFAVAERQSTFDRMTSESNALYEILTQAAQTAGEIRRYLLVSNPEFISDRTPVAQLVVAFRNVEKLSNEMNAELLRSTEIDLEAIEQINELLNDFRFASPVVPSTLFSSAPHTIVVTDPLEAHRLRDLSVLALYASHDPISVNDVLVKFLHQKEPQRNIKILTSKLVDDLSEIRDTAKSTNLEGIRLEGERLGRAIANYGREYGVLAFGSSESSLEETLEHARKIERQLGILERERRDGFNIKIALLEQEFPIRLVIALFPAGLVIGFGMVAMLLAYVVRRLAELDSLESRQNAGDIGVVFGQLRKGLWFEPATAWITLAALFGLPAGFSAYLCWVFFQGWTDLISWFMWGFTLFAGSIAIIICIVAYRISTYVTT